MKAQITIPKPCHEDWAKMSLTEKGRFCKLCTKEVIDFSNWEPEAILLYLKNRKPGSTCGRIASVHVNKDILIDEVQAEIYRWNGTWIQKLAAMIVLFFGLAMSSCNGDDKNLTGKVEPLAQQTVNYKKDTTIENIGVTLPVYDSSQSKGQTPEAKKPKPVVPKVPVKIPEPPIECHFIMGEPAVVDSSLVQTNE